jgi:hypothetical protein
MMVPWVLTYLENFPKVCLIPTSPGLTTAQLESINIPKSATKLIFFMISIFRFTQR